MTAARARRLRALFGATALALPPAGTTSRERGFCDAWLALGATARYDVVARDETLARRDAAARARVTDALTVECRNWHLLMDFEVRGIVERVAR